MRHLNWVLIGSLFLTACGTTKTNGSTPAESVSKQNPTSTTVATKETPIDLHPNRRATFHASRTLYNDIVHIKLELKPDWQNAYMFGVATITAQPHFYPQNTLVLDAQGMEIKSVKSKGQSLSYTYENDVLTIQLDKKYSRTEQFTVVIDYVAKPDERKAGGSEAIKSDKGLYFINPTGKDGKKMPQIWTQGETQSNSVWFPTIDSPNAKSSQEILITVEDKYVTLSNGKLISSKINKDGMRTDHWKQELKHAPYLFMLGIGEFKVVKDYYIRPNGSKMEVFYYVEPEWEQYARDIFGETPEMIGFFSKLLGVEFPWDKYHQIVVRDYVSGAMENTGAVVFGDFVYRTKQELIDANEQSIIAHELFHHWFGDLVTAESWSNLPLNEAFANYSQYLWDEYKYGKDQADYNAAKEEVGYLQQSQASGHHDLIWYDYDSREEMFDSHSYNKGGRILHMLRNYVGDEAFFTSLNKYLTDNAYQAAEHHHLRLAFEEVTGEDLNWFFQQWFTAKGHPVLDYSYEQKGSELLVKVKQKQNLKDFPIYKLPHVIAVKDDNGLTKHKVTLSTIDTTFVIPIKGNVTTIIPDYDEVLLGILKDGKSAEMFVQSYYNSTNWRTRNSALVNAYRAAEYQDLILDAMNDPFFGIRAKAIELSGRLKEDKQKKGIELIVKAVSNDKNPSVRTAAVNALAKLKYEGLVDICKERIASDSSFNVIGAALTALNQASPSEALLLAKTLEDLKSANIDVVLADMYVTNEDPRAFDFMKRSILSDYMSGFNEVGMLNILTTYGSKAGLDELDKVVDVLNIVKVDGGMYAQMFIKSNIEYLVKELSSAKEELNELVKENRLTKAQADDYLIKIERILGKIKNI